MQIEIDIEKLVSRSITDGILNSNNLQKEVYNILKTVEYQEILTRHIKARLNELLFSEDGKKQIDKSIIDGIVKSDKIQDKIEEILEDYKCKDILEKQVKTWLHEAISSEEGKRQISCKVKEYLEDYDIEDDDNIRDELNKGISDILVRMIKDSFERFKTLE